MPKLDDDLIHWSEDQLSDKLVIAEIGGRAAGLLTAKMHLLRLAGESFQEQLGKKNPDDSYAVSLRRIAGELQELADIQMADQTSRQTKYNEDYSEE